MRSDQETQILRNYSRTYPWTLDWGARPSEPADGLYLKAATHDAYPEVETC
jgi:hypothetical protein